MAHSARREVIQFPVAAAVGGEASGMILLVQRLSNARSMDEVTAAVTQAVRSQLQADGATFVLRDGDRCFYADEDAISPLWKGRRFPMSACISGWCMIEREPVAIADIFKDRRVPIDTYRPTFVQSLAMAPVGREEPVAALGAYWSERRQIRREELELLQTIADSAALAVAYVRLQHPGIRGSRRPAPAIRPPKPAASLPPKPPAQGRWSFRAFIERIRREGLRPNSPEAYGFAVISIAVATLAREGIGELGLHGVAAFSTYYPAVLLTLLLGGARAALLAAGLGGGLAYWVFLPHVSGFTPHAMSETVNLGLYCAASGLLIWMVEHYRNAVLRLKDEDARHLVLAREQRHRLHNAISVVEAIVRHSLRSDPDEATTINRRIRAGLTDVDLQEAQGGQPVSLRQLLANELQAFDLARIALKGDETVLSGAARNITALATHELATNAVKYGALSAPGGRVTLAWATEAGRTTIRWREAGGPPVKPPQKRGYGSMLLRRLVEAHGGAVTMEFRRAGVTAEIVLPLEPRRRR